MYAMHNNITDNRYIPVTYKLGLHEKPVGHHYIVTSIILTNKQGSFPAGTPGNGVPKVILTMGTAFPGTQNQL